MTALRIWLLILALSGLCRAQTIIAFNPGHHKSLGMALHATLQDHSRRLDLVRLAYGEYARVHVEPGRYVLGAKHYAGLVVVNLSPESVIYIRLPNERSRQELLVVSADDGEAQIKELREKK
jgi:hypothetical protein